MARSLDVIGDWWSPLIVRDAFEERVMGEVALRTKAPGHGKAVTPSSLSAATLLVFAVACGLSVANIYYAQPLLDAMATTFAIAPASIGMVVTLTQIGYALGLLLIVPLGDLVDRRKLIVDQAVRSAAALAAVGMAQSATVLLMARVAVGLLAVVVQVLVAFAATLAAPAERGRAVGLVTSGVVVGILLARFVAGLLADLGGWRSVYLVSAGLMLAMAALLLRILPRTAPQAAAGSYLALLISVPILFLQERVLRVRAVLALLIFAIFSTFWTSLVLPLSAPPLSLSPTQVGLFGLAGLAGALAASGAGRFADRGLGQWTTGVALSLMLMAWGAIALLHVSLAVLRLPGGASLRRGPSRPGDPGCPCHQPKHDLRSAPRSP